MSTSVGDQPLSVWERFGGSEEGVIKHLLHYAEDGLADSLRTYNGGLPDEYDWSLNEPE